MPQSLGTDDRVEQALGANKAGSSICQGEEIHFGSLGALWLVWWRCGERLRLVNGVGEFLQEVTCWGPVTRNL